MSDFYGDVQGARDYWLVRGYTVPAAALDDDAVTAWLIGASEWLDGVYRAEFGGYKVGRRAQVREWPRYSAFDQDGYALASDAIPREIEAAVYEAALRVGQGVKLTADYTPSKYRSVSIAGAISVQYDGKSAQDVQTQFLAIDRLLWPILTGADAGGSMLSGGAARV